MTGLVRGTVQLAAHQKEWDTNAEQTMKALKRLLGDIAVDIQHVGSTAIPLIHAKPIIDIAVGVRDLQDIMPSIGVLKQNGFVFRGEDVPGQVLLVVGDFENDVRTHHIHVVKWKGGQWENYINFRDYLNAFPEKARAYDDCKRKLAVQFPNDRRSYTAGKQELIECFLQEARVWRSKQ